MLRYHIKFSVGPSVGNAHCFDCVLKADSRALMLSHTVVTCWSLMGQLNLYTTNQPTNQPTNRPKSLGQTGTPGLFSERRDCTESLPWGKRHEKVRTGCSLVGGFSPTHLKNMLVKFHHSHAHRSGDDASYGTFCNERVEGERPTIKQPSNNKKGQIGSFPQIGMEIKTN